MSVRVLSIQSHVTYGYVGGKAAVFPLQTLGYDVDAVNTVNFSNHSGYGRFGGSKATADELTKIFDTMEANDLLTQDRLLTGYIPGAEALSVIATLVKRLKSRNPNLIYLLDPVLGDSGKLYVAPDVIPIYQELLPCSTVITPNWFEVETLTGIKLDSMRTIRQALRTLHEKYKVPNVVMSSMPIKDFIREALPKDLCPDFLINGAPYPTEPFEIKETNSTSALICISSSYIQPDTNTGDSDEISAIHAHILPCIPGYFSGVGDLFSALVLAHYNTPSGPSSLPDLTDFPLSHTSSPKRVSALDADDENDHYHTPLSLSTTFALTKTFSILQLTDLLSRSSPNPGEKTAEKDATDGEKDKEDPERRVRRQRARELRLVQGRDILKWVPDSPAWRKDRDSVVLFKLGKGNGVKVTTLVEATVREMRVWKGFWKE